MKHFFQIFLFIIPVLLLNSCQSSLDKILAEQKLVPVEIRYEVGDDGHDIFKLIITRTDNRFCAKEIQTDNFSWPQKVAYLKNDSLTEAQINDLRAYLLMASTMPVKCNEIAAVTQLTRITYSTGEILSEGACDWKDKGYFELRKSLHNPSDSIMRFSSSRYFTIYEGDWGKFYAARFEVWFKPKSGEDDRKLFEKNFKVQGWMH